MSRSKRDWSAKLPTEPRLSRLALNPQRSTLDSSDAQRGSRTHSRAGLSRAALPLAYLGEAEAVGLEPTSGFEPPPVFKTGPSSSRMTSTRRSSGGWNRTNGLLGQSQASLPAATAPDHFISRHVTSQKVRGEGVEPPHAGSKPASLPLADPRMLFLKTQSALWESNPPGQLGRLEPLPLGQGHSGRGGS